MNTHIIKKESHLGLAIAYIVLACFSYTILGICVKQAIPSTPIPIILFIRFLCLLVCILPFMGPINASTFKANRPWLLIIRGGLGVVGIAFMFYALKDIPLATAILLCNTDPIFIPFVFLLWHGTKIVSKLYYGILLGLVGVIFILHPTQGYLQYGAFLALAGGMMRAVTLSMVRVATKSDKTQTIMLYFSIAGTVVALLCSLAYWHHPGLWAWGWMIGTGLSSFVFQLGIVKSFSYAPARIMGPFSYLAVVFAAIADWFIWGIGMTWYVGVGIIFVILGAILTAVLGRDIL